MGTDTARRVLLPIVTLDVVKIPFVKASVTPRVFQFMLETPLIDQRSNLLTKILLISI